MIYGSSVRVSRQFPPHVCLAAVFPGGRAVAESAAAVLAPPTLRYRLPRVLAWETEKRLSLPLSLALPPEESAPPSAIYETGTNFGTEWQDRQSTLETNRAFV